MDPVSPTVPAVELPAGSRLQKGRFTIERVLGRGGFGITYAAHDAKLQRVVAVKQLTVADAKERFLREASVLARFSHPGIVKVFEVFEESGVAYLVMERLHGETLYDQLVRRSVPMAEGEALDVAHRCGQALMVMHGAGVLHRDLNPTNVMMTDEGRVVLIDFGLARDFVPDEAATMTRLVTPGYAPPEQYAGHGVFGPPTDVYGLAATLYRALTGVAPLSALDRHGGGRLESPRRRNPAVSKTVSDAVMDGLELDPAHRPTTMADFLARLTPPSSVPVPPVAKPITEWRPAPPPAPVPVAPAKMPGRTKVFVPAGVAVAALGAAAPLLALLVLTFAILPATATAGDVIVHRRMRRRKMGLPGYIPYRFVRNAAETIRVGAPALLIGAVIVAIGLIGEDRSVEEWIIRPAGATAAVLLAVPVMRDRTRFRAPIVGERALRASLDAAGRLTSTGISLWIVAALMALIGFGLRPDLWPLN